MYDNKEMEKKLHVGLPLYMLGLCECGEFVFLDILDPFGVIQC